MVDDFTYLGSIITKDGQLGHEEDSRVAKAARAFGICETPSSETPARQFPQRGKCTRQQFCLTCCMGLKHGLSK